MAFRRMTCWLSIWKSWKNTTFLRFSKQTLDFRLKVRTRLLALPHAFAPSTAIPGTMASSRQMAYSGRTTHCPWGGFLGQLNELPGALVSSIRMGHPMPLGRASRGTVLGPSGIRFEGPGSPGFEPGMRLALYSQRVAPPSPPLPYWGSHVFWSVCKWLIILNIFPQSGARFFVDIGAFYHPWNCTKNFEK